jgi:hypothetical protein
MVGNNDEGGFETSEYEPPDGFLYPSGGFFMSEFEKPGAKSTAG